MISKEDYAEQMISELKCAIEQEPENDHYVGFTKQEHEPGAAKYYFERLFEEFSDRYTLTTSNGYDRTFFVLRKL